MQNLDREHTGAFRLRWIGLFGAALACVLPVSSATASLRSDSPSIPTLSAGAKLGSSVEAKVGAAADATIQLAGNEHRGGNFTKPPSRGSSAELHGGSSADRYGGSSADRRGVAGRYDPRNRSIRQFSANERKREHRPKQNDEMDDQDQNPPQDMFSFTPPDPSAARDRSDRD